MKERAPRNRTLTVSPEEEALYCARLLRPTAPLSLGDMTNRTLCGDMQDMVALLPEQSVDLLLLDPPYNRRKEYHGQTFYKTTDEGYAEYLLEWFPSLLRLLKPEASVYFCCDWQSSSAVYSVMSRYFHIRSRITWQREKGRGAAANWKNCAEDIWFGTVGEQYTFNVDAVKQKRRVLAPYRKDGQPKDWEETEEGKFRLTHPSNFWDDISIPYWSMPENTDHPTQKPEKLFAKLILASSREGDMVLDPFCGSGTSSVVAKKLGRTYCGIEHNEQYCIWAEKRLALAERDQGIQGYTDGVFWERNSGK